MYKRRDGEIAGIVFDIDHFASHDGPGIRTSVFLKGCPLRCAWCHSPESQDLKPQLLYASARCVGCLLCAAACPHGLHSARAESQSDADENNHVFLRRELCEQCGRCAAACPSGALRMSGRHMTAAEVAREALADAMFFINSGGGVTLSGGEILFQAEFAREILRLIKAGSPDAPVHTIVETTGLGKEEELLSLVPYVDCFYYDYKLSDAALYERYIGGGMERVFANLKKLRALTDGIVLRAPLIPGITDTEANLRAAVDLAVELEIGAVHLLPYNTAASAKYEWVGREFALPAEASAAPDVDGLLAWARRGGTGAAARLQISVI